MSDNNNIIDPLTRQQIADFLPSAILKTLRSYEVFNEELLTQDAKDFSTHHTACKAAISHLELLLKLARWANITEDNADNETLMDMLSTASRRVEENDAQT